MHEQDLQRLASFCLMDDDFFSEALDGKVEAVEYILNTILESSKREILDVEIQRSDKGTGSKRARFHSSMIDRSLLSKGEDFEDLVDTYVIFIMENDKFKKGIPLYHVERKITELDNTLFGDGAHIIYVNGEFRNMEHPVGQLMHDFNCTDAKEIRNPLLAEEVRYLKETEGGRSQMCRAMEEMRNEAATLATEKVKHEMALKMLERGRDSIEEIAEMTGLPIEEVKELAIERIS